MRYASAFMASMMRSACFASAGLSTATPSSVFLRADRGSRFNDPISTTSSSMTASFAWRRPFDEPPTPKIDLLFGVVAALTS